jgi:hypothetical protein
MRVLFLLGAGLSMLSNVASAQNTDCNILARDLVVKNYQSGFSDYAKLVYLYSLTQMDLKTSGEALNHSGKVGVGPISIGPGTWSSEKQDQLRSDLQKYVNIEQIKQSAASLTISSGDAGVSKDVENCMLGNGGLYVSLQDRGKNNAVAELMWTSYPGTKVVPIIESVTVIHGRVVGGQEWAKKGTKLNEKLKQRIAIERSDPKVDVSVIVNTLNAGSGEGYLPPSELPPPPPPQIVRGVIEGNTVFVGSGGKYAGGANPCPGAGRSAQSCVKPQHGGTIVAKSGTFHVISQNGGGTGVDLKSQRESPEEYCVTFFASTGACEAEVTINGAAAAIEEYTVER